jgi:DNA primase
MPRITDSELKRLKEEISVERLVESSGVELKKAGKDFAGKCPFHGDDTASLVVTPLKNLWHCFGCSIGGGPIDWVMKKNGVSFRHAVELLREGIPALAADSGAVKHSSVRVLPPPVVIDADDQAVLQQVVSYYHERLKQSPEALGYLMSRGLNHPELIDTFKLGLADRTLGLRLPNKQRKDGAEIRTRLEKLGVYRESGHEHFNGSLVVPVFALNDLHHGKVCELYGRKIRDDLRPGTPKHLYLPQNSNRGRGVFNEVALAASREIILCEALIDALTFWCAGYRNVTSAYGIEGFTDEHLAAFKRHGTERVLIAYDRDEAGERGAQKLAERLLDVGIDCYRIEFPKGMDANDYALKVQPANKSLGLLIRKASWLGKGNAPSRDAVEPVMQAIEPQPQQKGASSLIDLAAKEGDDTAASLPASPVPTQTQTQAREGVLDCEVKESGAGSEITLRLGDRRYRVRGLAKNLSFELLKVNLLVSVRAGDSEDGERFYVDTLDLYSAKQRASYVAHAAIELRVHDEVLKTDLGRVLMKLEALQEAAVTKTLEIAASAPPMNAVEREAALALLTAPDLIDRIVADFAACGLIGEDTNKLVGYLAATSRKLAKPLGIVIQSSSAAGKSSLMDSVLAFVPGEDRVKYSAMTGQSLFYMGETSLKHKALAIVEEEGASRASYALKLLQSEGELTIASTGSDPKTGNLVTQQYHVEGPVALLLTTTARDVDEELMNRCLVLAVDEGRAQTRAIHRLQRERRTLEGLLAKQERSHLIALHQNAQRLLRPLAVLNPYAAQLSFPDQSTRLRRDHEKYLTLIDTIAFVHQHQREIKTLTRGAATVEYIEATLDDIALANRIAHDVLGRSLDELPPQTRRLITLIDSFVTEQCARQAVRRSAYRFSRRSLREAIAWGDTQLRVHLERLVELEYLGVHREGPGGKFVYELLYEVAADERDAAQGTRAQIAGLIDVQTLIDKTQSITTATATTENSRGQGGEVAGRLRGKSGLSAARVRDDELTAAPVFTGATDESLDSAAQHLPHALRASPARTRTHAQLASV